MATSDEERKDDSHPHRPAKEEMDNLYRDYELVFGLFKLDADIHYRRAQMMLALQTALLAGFYLKGLDGGLYSALFCFFAGLLSYFWTRYATSQRQFLELRKRMLRDIEARMKQGINMATVDQKVFHPENREQHKFLGSGEAFPDDKGEFSLSRIKAGTTKVEKRVAWSFFCVWIVLLVLTLKPFLYQGLCQIWPRCQDFAPQHRSAVFE